jgi:ATP-dependent 26S proteasome regulatory subunit
MFPTLFSRFAFASENPPPIIKPASIDEVTLDTKSTITTNTPQFQKNNKTAPCEPLVLHTPTDDEFVEIVQNKSFDPKKAAEQEVPMDYDPYALADFFETSRHPIEDGLLVGYDEHEIPLIVTDRDLETLTDEQINDKIRKDPKFHEFRDGFSSKRVQISFPDFKLPPEVYERNSLPRPGEITTALLVVDENQQPVYKQNGEKAIYFIRPLKESDLRIIQEMEMQEDDRAMNIEKRKNIQEDPDETNIYDARLKARDSSDTYTDKRLGHSIVKELEWPDNSTSHQNSFRSDIMSRMSYTQFWLLVRENRIDKVKLTDDKRALWVTTKHNAPGGPKSSKVGIPFDPQLPDHLLTHRVKIEDCESNIGSKLLFNITRMILPIILAVYIQKYLYNIGQPSKSSEDIFAKAKLERYHGQNNIGVTFNDVAGADSIKKEMKEIIEFFRSPNRFIEIGCRTPAGLLLAGPPGTGKTLIAKAVGGEAGVPFFSVAGTEFAEIYSGVGASRVRDMFEVARKNSPCILFIDEFDSIGKARENGIMGGSDENVATINQLLTELDGFEDNEGVLVMAATNRPTALDEALTRPGRFDRIITMGLPNVDSRASIFKVHARLNRVETDVDWNLLARATSGFSGAEIMNVMNVAATLTVQANELVIFQDRILDAFEKVVMERSNKGIVVNEEPVDDEIISSLVKRYVAIYLAGS